MSKAIVFADLHLHSHKDQVDRLHDCLEVLEWVFKQTIENGCRHLFFLGDLFHERSKIDVLNYLRTFETFIKHTKDKDFDVHLLVGNHDMYHRERWDVNSIKPLTAMPNVHIIDKPKTQVIDGRVIDWVPHTENPPKILQELKKDRTDMSLLLGHMAVHGALLNTLYGTKADVIVEYDNDMVKVDAGVFDDWEMTLLGHYHGAQHLSKKAEFIGSPLQLSFGEAFQQKHIILLDLETLEKEYIVNDFSPKHLIVTPDDIKNEHYDLTKKFVRVVVSDIAQQDLVDLKREITKNYKVISLDVQMADKKIEEDQTVIQDAKSILYGEEEMLNVYMDTAGVPAGLDRETLFEAGMSCLVEET